MQGQKVRGVADVVFLIDGTGSMSPCLDAVKENIGVFVDALSTRNANNATPIKHWRARVVAYRDFGCSDAAPLVEHRFVESAAELRGQLSSFEAEGGGDEPESLLEALYAVAMMPEMDRSTESLDPNRWRHSTGAARFIIVFTDASYHEPMVKPAGGTMDDVANLLASRRIILSLFTPDMPCHAKLSAVDKAEWNVIGDGRDPQKDMRVFVSDQKNFQATLMQLAKTITVTSAVWQAE